MQTQPGYDPKAIRALFDEMASTYGIVNFISSFGFAARWRHQLVEGLPLTDASHIVDLMSGRNELCRSVAPHVAATARMTAIDISPEMTRRARKHWPFRVEILLEDVLTWECQPASADTVISSFGLKTFDPAQQEQLSQRVARILRPGGTFSFVEISVPPSPLLRLFYLFYLNRVIPWIGRLFLGNPANYRLLGVYTEAFGTCQHFAECLRQQGLEVAETSYFFGCATGVRGIRPRI
ncbi:MAG TPA: class I SAM-dependent methyltransferase [Candidatus Binatus sp.]|nr:class I SAM-dependent methyltransferase [Candidatus Binatus sp.]